MTRSGRQWRDRGNAVVETVMLIPWILFLFVGILDLGYYCYALICTENAARVAAARTASDLDLANITAACQVVLPEMKGLPNAYTLNTCGGSTTVSAAQPVAVCLTVLSPVAQTPCAGGAAVRCADCPTTGTTPRSVQVSVTYLTLPMVPIPGLMMGQMQVTQTAEARIAQ